MSKASVFDHGWIDMVFEGRNKSYGAYQLRKQDARTTMLALFSGIAFMAMLVAVPVTVDYLNKDTAANNPIPDILDDDDFIHPVELTKIEPPKPEEIQPAGGTPIKDPTVAFTELVAATAPVIDPPTTDVVQSTIISTVTTDGNENGSITGTTPIAAPAGTGSGEGEGNSDGIIDANFADVAPLYPGGMDKFYKDVAKKFNVPEMDEQQVVRIFVSFVVEKDGHLTDIRVLNKPGHGLEKEAERVLKSLKAKWEPGKKAGKAVRTSYKLPITVQVH